MPAPSARITGVRCSFGSRRPGLSARMTGSSQFVTLPVKILAIVFEDRRRLFTCLPEASFRLYMMAVPPATSGRYW